MDTQRLIAEEDGITEISSQSSSGSQKDSSPQPQSSQQTFPQDSQLPGIVVTYASSSLPQANPMNSDEDYREINHGNIQEGAEENLIKTYPQRWYILTVFALLGFMQGGLCISWTVIAESVEAAFGWTDSSLTFIQSWLYVSFLLTVIPFTWLMDRKGLRISVVLMAVLLFLGTGVRCITAQTPWVTWLAHLGNILIGLAGPVAFVGGPVLSALWFPPRERATATAIMTVAGFGGNSAWFLLGPNLIEQPERANQSNSIGDSSVLKNVSSSLATTQNYSNIEEIKTEILNMHYGECTICLLLLLAVVIYYPSKPPSAPSVSASMDKLHFMQGFKKFFTRGNMNFWLVGLTYGISVAVYNAWCGLMDVNLRPLHVSEKEAGWLGFYAITVGCVAAVLFGRIADYISGSMKPMSVCLLVGSILATFGFLLIGEEYVPFNRPGLYASTIVQGICNCATIPLFYELAIESCYPITEVVTSGVMTILYNIFPLLFIIIFQIPNVGTAWMTWALFGCLLFCFPLLLFFKEEYRRLMVDKTPAIEDYTKCEDDFEHIPSTSGE